LSINKWLKHDELKIVDMNNAEQPSQYYPEGFHIWEDDKDKIYHLWANEILVKVEYRKATHTGSWYVW